MSHDKRWRLVCYDVRDPKRYRSVYKIVRGTGRAVQYSIFRCRLDDRETARLRWELAQVMSKEDRLLIVDLCAACASRVIARNHVGDWTEEPASFTILSRAHEVTGTASGDHGSVREPPDADDRRPNAAESAGEDAGADDEDP